ncbi:MAG: hypothetical protein B7Z66_04290 [Chromatiales bacterium 21-64-14]|nr:MAG: hypothetical protein B7Z66_04290 [Chromatiales bacterium 21-64-14]HQU14702.1 AMP-binding protein [Gammaproteobacteria bacterium]
MLSSPPAPASGEPLLALIRDLAQELRPGVHGPSLSLDSALDADAGIDSLGRMELLLRMERTLGWHLDEEQAVTAQTPRQLLAAVTGWHPAPAPRPATPVPAAQRHHDTRRIPADTPSLTAALAWHAEQHPDQIHLHVVGDAPQAATSSYAELLRAAEALASGLGDLGLTPGQPVALMLPTGNEFFQTFMGILLAGGVPVPLYPPLRMTQIEEHLKRQSGILANAEATFLVTFPQARTAARLLRARLPALRAVVTPEDLAAPGGRLHQRRAADDLALIQYTSGSTGDPKGVALRNGNLLANIRAMGAAIEVRDDDVFVSWLPLYHDMGLIGAWLGSLYHGHPLVVMPPLAFVARPQRWLQAIHTYRGTLSAAPNFAYDLCASRLANEDLEGLDLSSWRVAFNGAEPVHARTLEHFITRYAPLGFRRTAMTPVYGLAECSVGLAFPPLGRGPRIDHVQRDSLQPGRRVQTAAADTAIAAQVPSCGRALPGHQIQVVDDAGRALAERTVGHIRFRGPSATRGYYRNPEASAELLRDGWLETGDYGYLADGEIYLTGRAKELIIRGGRNFYPYELEQAVGDLSGIRKNSVAVFASPDPGSGNERLVVLAETRERDPRSLEQLRQRIYQRTLDLLQIPPDDVVLAAPRTVLKTSSGKIRRNACRQLYERDALGRRSAVWAQFLRLRLAAVGPSLRRAASATQRTLYAAYAWLVFFTMASFALLATFLPRHSWRIRGSRAAARGLLWFTGTPCHVRVLQPLPRDGARVLVSNHASYLDGILLWGLLPGRYRIVAKRELQDAPLVRSLLERIGTRFVDRFDPRRGAQDAEALTEVVRDGTSLLLFPEGTFVGAPGLQPFRMGAFVAAAQARVPVIPIAIRGTRAMLRGSEWFPMRGSVEITIGAPIQPSGEDWAAALALRDAARQAILRHCGEPDLQ